jgi:hypothetical protein
MLLSRSKQPPPEFTLGSSRAEGLAELQSSTKTNSGITVTYSLVLLKTPWPSQSF